jgi:hypothetical protein
MSTVDCQVQLDSNLTDSSYSHIQETNASHSSNSSTHEIPVSVSGIICFMIVPIINENK